MSNIGNDAPLPSDAVLIGSVPIYSSSTSPDYVWVTCFGSVIRMRVHEDSSSESVKADDVRFWNSDGHGRYVPQSHSYIDLGTVKDAHLLAEVRKGRSVKQRSTQKRVNLISELDHTGGSLRVALRVHGDDPCSYGAS